MDREDLPELEQTMEKGNDKNDKNDEAKKEERDSQSDDDDDEVDGDEDDDGDDEDEEISTNYAKPDSQVCRFCEKLFLQIMKGDKKDDMYHFPEHFEWAGKLMKSSKTCGLCWALVEATEDHLQYSPDLEYPWNRNMELGFYSIWGDMWTKDFCNSDSLRIAGIHEFQLNLGNLDGDPKFRFIIMTDDGEGPIPQRAIWSDTTPMQLGSRLPVLKEWLASCDANHLNCNKHVKDSSYLPTRLVDLFESSHAGVFNPKLVFTDRLHQSDIRYTTLSHPWGKKQPVQTSTANIYDFTEYIFPLYSRTKRAIPRTFGDAMKITRALGIRYIWIDCLCIIQDDPVDWKYEALHMADVYRGSFLNIVSLDGQNCNSGCGLDLGWGALSLSSSAMNGRRVKVRTIPANPAHVWNGHVNTRGWVFQELMLAPRILYCGRLQFFWQCKEKVYSEDGYIDHHVPLNIPRDRDGGSREYGWHSWVRDFSQRRFTKLKDRLPALYGVIQRHVAENGYTSILGMWEETLVDDLAWRTSEEVIGPASCYPTEQSGLTSMPSWSWLSMHRDKYPGGILYFPPLNNRVISTKINFVDVVWESEPYFSNITSTKLIVTGPLQKLPFEYDPIRRRIHPEGDEERYDLETYVIRLDQKFQEEPSYGDICDYWCLELEYGEDEKEQFVTFLVLEEENRTGEVPVFRRLGCGRMRYEEVGFDEPPIKRIELI